MTQTPSATFPLADAVELVHVVRNGFVESRTPGAAVVTGDRDRYLGVVWFDTVTSFMRQQQEALVEESRQDAAEEPA